MLNEVKKIINNQVGISDKIKYHNNIVNIIENNKVNRKISSNEDSTTYLEATNFEKWNNGTYDLWDVGFNIIDATEEKYKNIKFIEVTLYKSGDKIARRITVDGGVQELKKDDIFYGGLNGQLSCSFKSRDKEEVTRYWKSSPYDFTTPDKAEIKICVQEEDKNLIEYIVESYNLEANRPYLVRVK